jgi:putative membrane protein
VTPAARRERWVLRAARAAFVERGVADTRGRTGVLLYIAVAERRAVVLADLGVRKAVPAARVGRQHRRRALDQAVARGGQRPSLPPRIAALAELCGEHLPRQDDDVNELSDEVDS